MESAAGVSVSALEPFVSPSSLLGGWVQGGGGRRLKMSGNGVEVIMPSGRDLEGSRAGLLLGGGETFAMLERGTPPGSSPMLVGSMGRV